MKNRGKSLSKSNAKLIAKWWNRHDKELQYEARPMRDPVFKRAQWEVIGRRIK